MMEINAILDGRYKILNIIGKGGTSCVYLAEDLRLRNYCALKEVYKDNSGLIGGTRGGLIAEAAILTRLRHTGLPMIYDIFEDDYSYAVVMEYIEGHPLNRVLEMTGAQPEADVLRWGRQLCGVLQYLHSQPQPIIYRDMKPGNIMLKQDGNVVLIDFGAARRYNTAGTGDTSYIGTHGYAAPEQYDSERQTDARTDIYNLGVTLYHLVTGHDPRLPPYGVQPLRELNPNLSKKLERVIQKCTQQNPANRYQSADELLRDLKRIPIPKEAKPQGLFLLKIKDKFKKSDTAAPAEIPADPGTQLLTEEETSLLGAEVPGTAVLPPEQPEAWESTLWHDETAPEPQPQDDQRRKKTIIGLLSAACLMVVVLAGSMLALLSNSGGNGPDPVGGTVALYAGEGSGDLVVTVTGGGTYSEIVVGNPSVHPGVDPGVSGPAVTEKGATAAATGTKSPAEIAASIAQALETAAQSAGGAGNTTKSPGAANTTKAGETAKPTKAGETANPTKAGETAAKTTQPPGTVATTATVKPPEPSGATAKTQTTRTGRPVTTTTTKTTTTKITTTTTTKPITTTTVPPTSVYNTGDVAAINRIIDNNGLRWTKAPADGSSVPSDWDVKWSGGSTNNRALQVNLTNCSLSGSLNLSGLDLLEFCLCSSNRLTGLNVTANTMLLRLECTNNNLTALDVTKNTLLSIFMCDNNSLTTLDVSKNKYLRVLYCTGNKFKSQSDVIGIENVKDVKFDPQN
ncbi:MAG: protein kinase [Oscillospiraceae bacterium]|nr:protein kinase [Oscillospiraceae bacterium]